MKKIFYAAALAFIAAAAPVNSKQPVKNPQQTGDQYYVRAFTGQIVTGYFGGAGVHCSGTLNHFAEGFPFSLRVGLGYAKVPTGDAVAARRIFIDQATNGSPKSWGKVWDARMDILYPVKLFSLKHTTVFGGPRHAYFNAHFEYIGGNETFDVTSNSWGLGGGLETAFPVSPRVQMIFILGGDYYFRSLLSGHDTYYRPNGDDLHAKENFTYEDADAAIDQPDFEPRLMFGVSYLF